MSESCDVIATAVFFFFFVILYNIMQSFVKSFINNCCNNETPIIVFSIIITKVPLDYMDDMFMET